MTYMHVCIRYTMKRMRRNSFNSPYLLALAAVIVLLAARLAAQLPSSSGIAPLPRAESVINRSTDPYSGSVQHDKLTSETLDLTIIDALDRGLKYNLGLLLSSNTTAEARALRMQSLSRLLPNINGSFAEELQRINLKSFGFKFAGFPSSVGPFGITATSATGTWEPLNASSIDGYRAAGQTVKAAEFNYQDARDTVVLTVGANYLLVIAQESRVEAIQAEVNTAEALYQLAKDQEAAGLSPNIDTLRARVQFQAQQEALIQAENDLEKQRIALARVIGLPVQQKFRLVDRVPYAPVPDIATEGAFDLALQTRPDYKAALAQLRAAELRRSAAWKGYLPSVGVSGTYGVLGYTADSMAPNYTAAASLNIPIFQGGRVQADVKEADVALKTRQEQADSLKGRIEQEVQDSILDLKAAARQVEVAKIGLELAQQTVDQSQDRFAAGVTNNVEVIQAQQQLAAANDLYISSLFAHNIAKVLLARAIGNAEQMVKQYLAGSPALPPSVLKPDTPPAAPPDVPPSSPNPPQPK
jgi:outer membrane protein TolC